MSEPVAMWEPAVGIPTYPAAEPDSNPMFLARCVYPLPCVDHVSHWKVDRTYRTVFLKTEYRRIVILPELEGRVYRTTCKANGYGLVYYNRVRKLALIGLAGPWISGGIEFGWLRHHLGAGFPLDASCLVAAGFAGQFSRPERSAPEAFTVSGELPATVDRASALLRAGRCSPAQPPGASGRGPRPLQPAGGPRGAACGGLGAHRLLHRFSAGLSGLGG